MILSNGGVFGPAQVAVAHLHVDIFVMQSVQRLFGLAAERGDDLDRVDFGDELGEHGRLVAAAGADLQHLVARLRVDGFGHVGHDERRRDGLAFADGQRHVEVGVLSLADAERTRAAACCASPRSPACFSPRRPRSHPRPFCSGRPRRWHGPAPGRSSRPSQTTGNKPSIVAISCFVTILYAHMRFEVSTCPW